LIDGRCPIKVGGPVSDSVRDRKPPALRRARLARALTAVALAYFLTVAVGTGCTPRSRAVPKVDRKPIDRAIVEGPAGFTFQRYI
jgi:hypothetical protein